MMLFKDALTILKKSKEFKEWKKKNLDAYLSYGFFVVEKHSDNWKIGFYHKKEDKITSFNIGKKIIVKPEEEVFKKDKTMVKKIDLEKVNLDLDEAIKNAIEFQKKEFSNENPQKIIAILQNIEIGQVWNITFITQNLNTLNIKIDSYNGRVLDKKLTNLMEFKKK